MELICTWASVMPSTRPSAVVPLKLSPTTLACASGKLAQPVVGMKLICWAVLTSGATAVSGAPWVAVIARPVDSDSNRKRVARTFGSTKLR